jgi:hypothetical protein
VNLGAPLFERDLVHRQLHDVDTASVLRFKIFDSQGIRNAAHIKAWSETINEIPLPTLQRQRT